jgi:hypothetical protein
MQFTVHKGVVKFHYTTVQDKMQFPVHFRVRQTYSIHYSISDSVTACSVTCVLPKRNTARQGTNVLNAMWGCVLTPASGCTTPNHNFKTNLTLGEADHTIVRTIFYSVLTFLIPIYCYITRVREHVFYERGKKIR